MGAVPDVTAEYFAPLSAHVVLVAPDAASPAARAAHDRLAAAGFGDIRVLLGGAAAVAA